MRTLATLLLSLLAIVARAQLYIDGRAVAFDEQSHLWLATLPGQQFQQSCQLSVRLADAAGQITINGVAVEDHYTFENISAESMYPAIINAGQGRTTAGVIMFTSLPVVQLWGEFGTDYTNGQVQVTDPMATASASVMLANVKWRGGSTNGPDKHKHNYKVKFPADVSLLGLRKDNNWILDAGQIDPFRLRNRVATDLWNDFATPPYYADLHPDALTGARGRVVEVFLNDRYHGVYNLSENMDRKQMKVEKCRGGAVHGCIYKSSGYGISTMRWSNVPPTDNLSETWDTFEVKYPQLNDNDTTDWQPLHDAIYFASHATSKKFAAGVAQYFDVPVLIDYFLFTNMLLAVDNTAKNMIWAVCDKQADPRLTVGVWDLDCTVGQRWLTRFNPRYTSPSYPLIYGTVLMERLTRLDVDGINQRIVERYHQLRQTCFSTDSLRSRYQAAYDLLVQSGAAQREMNRWDGDTDLCGQPLDLRAELDYICNWIQQRALFLDRNLNEQALLSVDNVPTATPREGAVYSLSGQKMPARGSALRPGLYIKDGRKYVVGRHSAR